MKKILLLSMCLLGILVSCSGEDDNDVDDKNVLNSSNLVGHWKFLYVSVYDKDTSELVYEGEDVDSIEMKFYEDGTCWYYNFHALRDGLCNLNKFYGTYKLLGNELDIYNDNKDYRWVIEEFGSDKMKISEDSWSYYDWRIEKQFYGKPIYTMERVN